MEVEVSCSSVRERARVRAKVAGVAPKLQASGGRGWAGGSQQWVWAVAISGTEAVVWLMLMLLMSWVFGASSWVRLSATWTARSSSLGRNHGRPASGRVDYCVISTSVNPHLTWVGAAVLGANPSKLQKLNIFSKHNLAHISTLSLQMFPNTRHFQRAAMM